MVKFYKIKRDDGVVILPKNSLALAVATEGNIHLSFKTGLQQEVPQAQGQPPLKQDIIERVDIKISNGSLDYAEDILQSILMMEDRVADIVDYAIKMDSTAQLRQSIPPILTLNKGKENELLLPIDMVVNITNGKGVGGEEITFSLNNQQKVILTTDSKFVGFDKFLNDLREKTAERLLKEVDLKEYGIIAFRNA